MSKFRAENLLNILGHNVMRNGMKLLAGSVLVGLFTGLTACDVENNNPVTESSIADSQQEDLSAQASIPAPMNMNGQIAFAKKDLAKRLDVDLDSIKLSSANAVTWRSGSLGCPEPGKMYTEALVPGAVIYLQVNNMIHAYHAKFAGEPFYCPR